MLRYIDRHHLFGQSEPIARHHKVQQAFSAVIWTVLGSIISLNTWTPVLAQDKVNFDQLFWIWDWG